MPGFSAFHRCANGFRCSSRKPLGRVLFEQMRQGHGGAYQDESFEGPVAGRWFAKAMMLARADSTLRRAGNQADPTKIYDLLPNFERHYALAPGTTATLASRRQALAAAMQLSNGPRRGNVEYQLRTALGSDFVAWVTTPGQPPNPPTYLGTAFPDEPWNTVGLFDNPTLWKTIRLGNAIAFTGVTSSVIWSHVSGDTGAIAVGDKLVVEPGRLGQQELITVTARAGSILQATFARPHEGDVLAIRRPWPFWCSNSKHSYVVVPNGRARDPGIHRTVFNLLRKLLGATSSWDIVEEDASPGAVRQFTANASEPNIHPVKRLEF